eukprot:7390223-Prymnesium_polylepis.4
MPCLVRSHQTRDAPVSGMEFCAKPASQPEHLPGAEADFCPHRGDEHVVVFRGFLESIRKRARIVRCLLPSAPMRGVREPRSVT